MNKERRKSLDKVVGMIHGTDVADAISALRELIEKAKSALEEIKEDEQDAFDNLPEGLQDGDRGQVMTAAIENMEEAECTFDEMIEALDGFADQIDNIKANLDTAAE